MLVVFYNSDGTRFFWLLSKGVGREEEIALFQIAYQKPEELDWKYIDILTESKKPYYLFFSLYIAYQHSILKEQMQEAENYKSKIEQMKHLVPNSF